MEYSADAPPGPYKVQPETQGRVLWFTGAPGLGKSTSAQILARNHGYVYYEADCFGRMKNPYIPLDDENPSMAQIHQKTLRGPGAEERRSLLKRRRQAMNDLMSGGEYDKAVLREFHRELALDIAREKKRIGGDFAVASFLLTRDVREAVREVLGTELTIVSLAMPKEDKMARLRERHEGDTSSVDIMELVESLMEPVKEEEPGSLLVEISGSMTREQVVNTVRRSLLERAESL